MKYINAFFADELSKIYIAFFNALEPKFYYVLD